MEKKWWTLVVVCAATFMLLLDITIVIVALPTIQSGLHASFSDVQWVVDAYALTLASVLLTAGSLADRYGRRLLDVYKRQAEGVDDHVKVRPENLGLLDRCVKMTERFHARMRHFVDKGPHIKPIRPEYLAATLNTLAADDALFFADTGTAIIWAARLIEYGANRCLFGSFSWASMANASPNAFGAQTAFPGRQTIALCGDGGFTMLALGDLLTCLLYTSRCV